MNQFYYFVLRMQIVTQSLSKNEFFHSEYEKKMNNDFT